MRHELPRSEGRGGTLCLWFDLNLTPLSPIYPIRVSVNLFHLLFQRLDLLIPLICHRPNCGNTRPPRGHYCSGKCKRADRKRVRKPERPYRHCIYAQRARTLRKYGCNKTWDELFAAQDGACACCGKETLALEIDHCHVLGMFRGLLCRPCNAGLGMFKDSTILLLRAIAYLRHTNTDKIRGTLTPVSSTSIRERRWRTKSGAEKSAWVVDFKRPKRRIATFRTKAEAETAICKI